MTLTGPLQDYSLADLIEARGAVVRLVDAVRLYDNTRVATLVHPEAYRPLGLDPGRAVDWFRKQWRVDDDELDRMSPTWTARLLDAELVGFGIVTATADEVWRQTTLVEDREARAVAMVRSDDLRRWLMWGWPDPDDWRTAPLVSLGSALDGPRN